MSTWKLSIRLVMVGFLVMATLVVIMEEWSVRKVNTLVAVTEQMHQHPLAVSNSLLEANADIIAMHRHMKDVVLSQNDLDLESAIAKVEADEAKVYRHLDIVKERFLGNTDRIDGVIKTFTDWRAIRHQVIDLVRAGRTLEAAQITKGKGALHVDLLNSDMNGLIEFARNKAKEFLTNSRSAHMQSIMEMRILMMILLVTGVVISIFIISKVKQGGKKLAESEAKFHTLYDSSSDAIMLLDDKGFFACNLATLSMFGCANEEEFCSKHPADLSPAEQPNGVDSMTAVNERMELAEKEGSNSFEWVLKRYDTGREFPVDVLLTAMVLNGRTVLQATVRDISDRKEAEEELHQYEHIVSSSSDMMALLDNKYVYLAVNKSYQNIFALTAGDLIGKTVSEVFGEEFFETVIKPNAVICLAGEVVNFQAWFDFPTLGKKYMDVNYYPYFGSGKEVQGFVVNGRDITKQKGLESQLIQSQKMDSLGTLAGGIAHDFNNMLGIIMGNADLCMLKLPDESSSERGNLEAILEAGNRSADLVNQILTFSRMDITQQQPLNMSLIVEEVFQMLRATIPTNIKIKQEIPETCRNVLADKTQIHQVVMNLAANAFHAMEEKGGILAVTLKERECEDCSLLECPRRVYKTCLQLTVEDTGYGIFQEDRENIFDPFFTTKEIGKGTGLGLTVAYSIVQRHDGVINIASEVKKGTTVKVCLPIIEEKEEEAVLNLTEDNFNEGSGDILLVEDEASLAKMHQEFLEGSGYVVTVCTDGSDALRLFQEKPSRVTTHPLIANFTS